ncbi:hypothetical protein GQ42DRAFT_176084 [Ramicandelaber brevisporus]|nr:hypothetical protein GQ42DRAFT_176084 [Ramicandelaber brevisporus]
MNAHPTTTTTATTAHAQSDYLQDTGHRNVGDYGDGDGDDDYTPYPHSSVLFDTAIRAQLDAAVDQVQSLAASRTSLQSRLLSADEARLAAREGQGTQARELKDQLRALRFELDTVRNQRARDLREVDEERTKVGHRLDNVMEQMMTGNTSGGRIRIPQIVRTGTPQLDISNTIGASGLDDRAAAAAARRLDDALAKVVNLETDIRRLQTECNEKDKHIDELQQDNDRLLARIARGVEQPREQHQQSEYQQRRAQSASPTAGFQPAAAASGPAWPSSTEWASILRDNGNLRAHNREMERQLDQMRIERDDAHRQQGELEHRIRTLRSKREGTTSTTSAATTLRQRIVELEAQVEELQENNRELSAELAGTRTTSTVRRQPAQPVSLETHHTLLRTNERLDTAMRQAMDEVDQLRSNLSERDDRIRTLERRITAVTRDACRHQTTIASLQAERDSLAIDLADAFEHKQSDTTSSKAAASNWEIERTRLLDEIQQLVDIQRATILSKDETKAKYVRVSQQSQHLSETLAKVRHDNELLQAQLQSEIRLRERIEQRLRNTS